MSFRDIKGHNQPINLLKIALSQNRFASAYLFTGEGGIGKSLVAKTIAKAINCLQNNNFDSCDQCISCRKIENLTHPDVHWITPENQGSAIKIEQIRKLKQDISLKAYQAKSKVFIIEEAHNLTAEAQNAFLKILEEPPAHSLIILISSKPQLIFSTILSRCQKIRFRPLSRFKLEQFLISDLKLDLVLSHYLAYFCEGRIGEALGLKDKDILREKNRIIDEFTFSRTSYETIELNRHRFREILDILVSWFRDMYFIKVGLPFAGLINLDRKEDLLKVMGRYSYFDLDSIIDFISDSTLYLEQNINLKLLMNNLRIRLWKGQWKLA